jgi:phosphoribosyl-AMP cyclohydrolase
MMQGVKMTATTPETNTALIDFPIPVPVVEEMLESLTFNSQGLISAIAQQFDSGEILMLAWMNADAIRESLATGRVCYWSRSRGKLWRKGETSGQVQKLVSFRIDCDRDCILLLVDQFGVACHTGRRSCFYTEVTAQGLVTILPVEKSPAEIYGNDGE